MTVSSAPRGVRVHAPAKLNLLLHVLARETSGYHGLETLFLRLALGDHVTIRTDGHERELAVSGPAMPPGGLGAPEANLAWRAAERFADATGWPDGFAITIDKHIPVGGGLGGGSTDAAAVLRGLNAIAPTPLGADRLLALAGELGADVPFLVSDHLLAWGWGRGDRLLGLPPLPPMAVTLVTFAEGVNTGAAFGALATIREQRAARQRGAQDTGEPGTAHPAAAPGAKSYVATAFSSWLDVMFASANDFETVAPLLHTGVGRWLPLVRAEAARLRATGVAAIGLMSGSGATCAVIHPAGTVTDLEPPVPGSGTALLPTTTAAAIVAPEPIL